MADNYLEKKMDDYRRGSLRTAPRVHSGATSPWRMSKLRVFVGGNVDELTLAVVTRLVACGCRVAFCEEDLKAGRAAAQASGALHLPVSSGQAESLRRGRDMAAGHWDGVDAYLLVGENGRLFLPILADLSEEPMRVVALNCSEAVGALGETFDAVGVQAEPGCRTVAVANLCCFLMAPDNRSIRNQIIVVAP